MCGINGLWTTREKLKGSLAEQVKRMSGQLIHRGPDGEGQWVDLERGIGLGHRRLAIVDLSDAGAQPMRSESGRFVLAFNGEIYNHRDLRQKLTTKGHRFKGHSDTEVLLALIEDEGLIKALKAAVGMFAISLWDSKLNTLSLARDRMGEKPIYLASFPGLVAFASELKAIKTIPDLPLKVNTQSLSLFFRHGYVPAPLSIYDHVIKLKPGSIRTLTFDDVSAGRHGKEEIFWALNPQHKNEISADEAVETLDRLLQTSIQDQMVADVPVGCFLSGGIDSSAVTAVMQKLCPRPIKTFSIGFHEAEFNEAHHASKVAKHLGTDHTELYVTAEETRAVIPLLPKIYDEPFADSSQIPTYLVSKLARSQVTVSLSGDAGDELFGGYNRYTLAHSLWNRLDKIPLALRNAASRATLAVPPKILTSLGSPFKPLMPSLLSSGPLGDRLHKAAKTIRSPSLADLYLSLVSLWSNPELLVGGDQGLNPVLLDNSHKGNPLREMMFKDSLTYLPDDILVKVDRASMAVSLESRVPMLDHRIVEFAFSLPMEFKVRGREGKWVLRQVLDRYVPRSLIERPKMGFGVPIGEWLKGPLRDWASTLMDPAKLRSQGYLNPDLISTAWEEHLSGRRNWQYQLWTVLMFQSWLENEGHG